MINAQDHRLWAHYRIISGDLGLSSRGSSNRRASTTSTANILSECAWDCLIDATQNSVYCVSDDISCLCEDFSARQVALNCIEDLCSTSDTTTFEEYMDKCGARPSGEGGSNAGTPRLSRRRARLAERRRVPPDQALLRLPIVSLPRPMESVRRPPAWLARASREAVRASEQAPEHLYPVHFLRPLSLQARQGRLPAALLNRPSPRPLG
ncbi:hypothetical protein BD414DRAFT_281072 [Trametes punicea]|nr:hypothetical protein BD414DRAFT_281072 [Trametes punicea]